MHRRPLRMKAVSLFPNAHAIHKVQRGLAEICVGARRWRIPPLFVVNPPLVIQIYFIFFLYRFPCTGARWVLPEPKS